MSLTIKDIPIYLEVVNNTATQLTVPLFQPLNFKKYNFRYKLIDFEEGIKYDSLKISKDNTNYYHYTGVDNYATSTNILNALNSLNIGEFYFESEIIGLDTFFNFYTISSSDTFSDLTFYYGSDVFSPTLTISDYNSVTINTISSQTYNQICKSMITYPCELKRLYLTTSSIDQLLLPITCEDLDANGVQHNRLLYPVRDMYSYQTSTYVEDVNFIIDGNNTVYLTLLPSKTITLIFDAKSICLYDHLLDSINEKP